MLHSLSISQTHLIEKLCQSIKPSKVAYTKVITQTVQFPITLVEKWKLELDDPLLDQNIISSSFMKLYAATVSTKIQSFQYRLAHTIMGTNSKLYKWDMRLDNKCDFYKHKEENYIHLFFKCEKIQTFWREVKRWIQKETDNYINFTSSEIPLGTPEDTPPLFDLFLITAKMLIYYCKFKGIIPNLDGFINNIKFIEKYIAVKNNKTQVYNRKWFITNEDVNPT